MRITQITLFVTRRHVCLLYSQKEPSQRYVDINELDRQLTLVNRYSYQRFLKITLPRLRWTESLSSWRYGIRVVSKTLIACALCRIPTRTLFLSALALLIQIPWTTSWRRCEARSLVLLFILRLSQWIGEVNHFCQGLPIILVGLQKDRRRDPKTIDELRRTSQRPVTVEEVG